MDKPPVKIPVPPVSYRKFIEEALVERRRNFLRQYDITLKHVSRNRVHDLRISIRRLATMLGLLENLKRSWKLRASLSDLRQLMKKLGALRDIQVFLKWLDYFSPGSGNGCQQIRDLWIEEEKQLASDAVSRLRKLRAKRIGDFPVDRHMDAVELRLRRTGTNIEEACQHILSRRFGEFIRSTEKFKRTGKTADLHLARIAFKKFRYSIEMFLPFYHGIVSEELHAFQTDLGTLNDLDLFVKKLTGTAEGTENAPSNLQPLLDKVRAYHQDLFQKVERIFKGEKALIETWKDRMRENTKTETGKRKTDISKLRPEVVALCERFDPDPPHAFHVTLIALKLFDELKKLGMHKLDDHQRNLLEYGCLLHDIGWVKGHKKHHKLSYTMILESELTLNRRDKLETALIARFHRKAEPDKQKDFLDLTPRYRSAVAKLAAIIRIADLLDRVHNQKAMIEHVALGEGAVVISLSRGALKGLTVATIAAKSGFFSKAFRIPVRITEGNPQLETGIKK